MKLNGGRWSTLSILLLYNRDLSQGQRASGELTIIDKVRFVHTIIISYQNPLSIVNGKKRDLDITGHSATLPPFDPMWCEAETQAQRIRQRCSLQQTQSLPTLCPPTNFIPHSTKHILCLQTAPISCLPEPSRRSSLL